MCVSCMLLIDNKNITSIEGVFVCYAIWLVHCISFCIYSPWCLLWIWSAKSFLVKTQFYSYPKWITAPCHVSDLSVLFHYIILFKTCTFMFEVHTPLQLSLVASNYWKFLEICVMASFLLQIGIFKLSNTVYINHAGFVNINVLLAMVLFYSS